ncbi:sulfite oxidase [soil metagenome]
MPTSAETPQRVASPVVADDQGSPTHRWRFALAGLIAASAALGVSEAAAALFPGAAPPVTGVGGAFIDVVPTPVKELAIQLFGTADKVVLLGGILAVAAVAGAVLGIAAARRFAYGIAGFAAFAALGIVATLTDPRAGVAGTASAIVVGAVAGSLALWVLLRAAAPRVAARDVRRPDDPPEFDRRRFLVLVAGTAAVAGAGGLVGRRADGRAAAVGAIEQVSLPPAADALPPAPAGAALDVPGLSALYTPNDAFYRIDTALSVPRVDVAAWTLAVDGMVDRPLSLSFADLLDEELVEVDVTLCCVSNEVGGGLVGNARWLGVPLSRLLERAGVQEGAGQVVGRSVDGFTAGFPTEIALREEDALVAVGMNGDPLPLEHGFPARLVVPGLYGYVSATKWLSAIELTTWEGFDAYWVPRGWDKEGPVKTQSRIDVPAASAQVAAGTVAVAGVAWAQPRGVERVEVQVDDGQWADAELADALDVDTWRQWVYRWDAAAGDHTLRVRATDGDGQTQTEERRPPAPDGASGWHEIRVTVA